MVGTLIAAGNGQINQRNLYEMLTIPSTRIWNQRTRPAPSYGLYLSNVEYSAEILENCIQTIEGNDKEAIDKEDTYKEDLEDIEAKNFVQD